MPFDAAFLARFRRATAVVLVCYWLAMFLGTHWPNFSLQGYPQHTDKVLHFSAYGGLAFLLALWLWLKQADPASRRPGHLLIERGPLRAGLWIMGLIVVYSIFDEVSQIPVGRDCDYKDALADWVGGIIGLSAFAVCRPVLDRAIAGRVPGSTKSE